jgi:hypothetical protein
MLPKPTIACGTRHSSMPVGMPPFLKQSSALLDCGFGNIAARVTAQGLCPPGKFYFSIRVAGRGETFFGFPSKIGETDNMKRRSCLSHFSTIKLIRKWRVLRPVVGLTRACIEKTKLGLEFLLLLGQAKRRGGFLGYFFDSKKVVVLVP